MSTFNWFSSSPFYLFSFALFVIFGLFLWGVFLTILAGRSEEVLKRGRKITLISLYCLFVVLLAVLVFFLVSYLVKKGDVFKPPVATGEFPSFPAVYFPPPPEFVIVGEYYFLGPWLLKEYGAVAGPSVYSILCKKNEEYDIMYVEETEKGEQLLRNEQYKCWVENCSQGLSNLYLAVIQTPPNRYTLTERKKIKDSLIDQVNPPCPELE